MQFTKRYKEAIVAGQVTTSFRAWQTPQAKLGGEYNIAPFGAIKVTGIKQCRLADVKVSDIQRSGFENRQALVDFLKVPEDAQVYQVDLEYLGPQAVNQNDTSRLGKAALADIQNKLKRMDQNTPWTSAVLALIDANRGIRAGDLAPQCGMDQPTFKRNVRKLKALGLTISLETGYRLSPRGSQLRKAQHD